MSLGFDEARCPGADPQAKALRKRAEGAVQGRSFSGRWLHYRGQSGVRMVDCVTLTRHATWREKKKKDGQKPFLKIMSRRDMAVAGRSI